MHCISVYVTKDDGTFEDVPHLKIPQGFVLFTNKPKGLKKGRAVAYCETDYFGGAGQQTGKLWDKMKNKIFDQTSSYAVINEALELLGVKRDEGKDEFDTIGLGNFRTNHDIDEEIYKKL
tara:strand:+ start:1192 stop:1551 length:360 start_codon:yes stop_codon:yes gene_type:complete